MNRTNNRTAIQTDRYCNLFSTLANKNRFKIIAVLREKECNVTEITEQTQLSQTCVSHCLAVLQKDGFVKMRREGKFRIYIVDEKIVDSIIEIFNQHIQRQNM